MIDARALLSASDACSIDLRSPAEFDEDHVPGAVNAPLFDDVQRALVGTLYRDSPSAAFEAAANIVRVRIRDLAGEIGAVAQWSPNANDLEGRANALLSGGYERLSSELLDAERVAAPGRPIVFNCWRGGLRSRSVLAFVRDLGLERAALLDGGYKSYRAEVVRQLAELELPPVFVLRGMTGVGKTLVLRAIERARPGWTLDLEELAGHRSSLLGMVGLAPCSQKRFESRIAARARAGFGSCVVIEGESRRVGDAIVPERVWRALEAGTSVEVHASFERRFEVLVQDYLADERTRAELEQRLPLVEARMVRAREKPRLVELLRADRIEELVRELLDLYYDPLYRHGEKERAYAARFDAADPDAAARAIVAWIEARRATGER